MESRNHLKTGQIPKSHKSRKIKINFMIKKLKSLFAQKKIVATAKKIKSGYSAGAADGSSSGQWRKV